MNVIIGSGITGLILAKRIPNSVVLELQPLSGGLYATDIIAGYELPLVPPLVRDVSIFKDLFDISYEVFRPNIVYEKEQYLKDKICKECDDIPPWLDFSSDLFWINNINALVSKLSREIKIIHEYPTNIRDKKILTNKGRVIDFENIINTGSRLYINKLLGINENIGSKSLFLTILITSGQSRDSWNIYVNGHSGVSISHIIRKELEANIYVNYIYGFFAEKLLDIKKIFNELKRLKIFINQNIIGFRSHVLKESILFGETGANGILGCGRLGLWKNFTLEEAIDSARKLQT